MCGCYRKFIKEFSTLANPLTNLTRKCMENKIKWSDKCQLTFTSLKDELMRAPVLITPDWSKPFILQTDASAYELGYILSQLDDKKEEHPIAFASKKLLPNEKNHSAIEREALGIVKGIKHFRTYLEGNQFITQTDHNPLIHLENLKDSHGRLARWAISLQHHQFRIEHQSGRANVNADALSQEPESVSKGGGVLELMSMLILSSESLSQFLRVGSVRATGERPSTNPTDSDFPVLKGRDGWTLETGSNHLYLLRVYSERSKCEHG